MNVRIRYQLGLLLSALLLLSGGAASAQDRHDMRIADEIGRELNKYTRYTIFDHVGGTVENGVATLTGKVTMPYKKNDIAKRVASIEGVREVLNQIEVLPVSNYDEELRRRVARAIYGNSAFWQYAARANPPIHIIVENGHVTLVGVVNSNVDRMLARSLATGFGELSVTNQLRTDAEMKSE
jgi:hyperosmotically inducible protein